MSANVIPFRPRVKINRSPLGGPRTPAERAFVDLMIYGSAELPDGSWLVMESYPIDGPTLIDAVLKETP